MDKRVRWQVGLGISVGVALLGVGVTVQSSDSLPSGWAFAAYGTALLAGAWGLWPLPFGRFLQRVELRWPLAIGRGSDLQPDESLSVEDRVFVGMMYANLNDIDDGILRFEIDVCNGWREPLEFPPEADGVAEYQPLSKTLRRIRVESISLEIAPGTTGKIRLMIRPREDIVSDLRQRIDNGENGVTFRLTDLRVEYSTGGQSYRLPLPDGVNLRQGVRLGEHVYLQPDDIRQQQRL